jgi:hypothetical protein
MWDKLLADLRENATAAEMDAYLAEKLVSKTDI